MRILLAVAVLMTSTAAMASIKVPFFNNLKEQDVCGAIPKDCQPNSSHKWSKVSGLDYRGITMLGRKYGKSVFETEKCFTPAVTENNVQRFGTASIKGSLKSSGKSGFGAKANATLDESLRDLIGPLPEGLKAKAKLELSQTVNKSLTSEIELSYERVDLSYDFIDEHLASCMATMGKGEKVITGLSIISTSGNWTRGRISEFVAGVEASAEFQSLNAEAKARWNNKKNLVLAGEFKPVTFVFAVAYRQKP